MKVRVTKKLSDAPIEIPIHTEFIKLQDFLKFANALESGGMAKTFIQEGEGLGLKLALLANTSTKTSG